MNINKNTVLACYDTGNYKSAYDAANCGAAYLLPDEIEMDDAETVLKIFSKCLGTSDLKVAALPRAVFVKG